MMKYIILLLLIGCGGAPFTLAELGPDAQAEGPSDPMPSVIPDASHEAGFHDAGGSDGAMVSQDGRIVFDAQATDGAPDTGSDTAADVVDAGAPGVTDASADVVDAGAVEAAPCLPMASSVQYCGQSARQLIAPGQYCASGVNGPDSILTTPPECQCAGTYTCACLVAHVQSCPGQKSTCMPSDPYVHLICN